MKQVFVHFFSFIHFAPLFFWAWSSCFAFPCPIPVGVTHSILVIHMVCVVSDETLTRRGKNGDFVIFRFGSSIIILRDMLVRRTGKSWCTGGNLLRCSHSSATWFRGFRFWFRHSQLSQREIRSVKWRLWYLRFRILGFHSAKSGPKNGDSWFPVLISRLSHHSAASRPRNGDFVACDFFYSSIYVRSAKSCVGETVISWGSVLIPRLLDDTVRCAK